MKLSLKLIALIFLCTTAFSALAQGKQAEHAKGVNNLLKATNGKAQVSVDKQTGQARFVRLPKEYDSASKSPPQARAMGFLRKHGDAFGVSNANAELSAVGTRSGSMGSQHSVFRQTYNGLPVFAGELRAHFDANGNMYAVNGNFVSKINVDTNPSVTADEAAARATRTVSQQEFKRAMAKAKAGDNSASAEDILGSLHAVTNNLMVFRSGLVQGLPGRDHLAFEVEVTNADVSVREFVYVDAHNGKVIEQYTGIYDALNRRAFDGEGSNPGPNYPATPYWVEGDPLPTASTEADNIILASGETYDLYSLAFGRDSFDGGGATMDAIFDRGTPINASWNGVYISFSTGLTTDDITGHEWGHAYTQYTNDLIYAWQSGALNESYSDIFGEVVDLINGREGLVAPVTPRTDGNCSDYGPGGPGDDSIKWLLGEDYSALRDMWNPNCAGDPGKVTDAEYICTTFDNGGVHINSGIPNHAFALMVDGGTFNGYSDAGFGLTKATHIQWLASTMLTPASNFADNADALEAACGSLIGVDLNGLTTGAPSGEMIDASDCDQVAAINDAVEFRTPPDQCGFESLLAPDAPALCEGVGSVQTIMSEDFESGSLPAGWSVGSHDVVDPGTFTNPGWSIDSSLPAGNGSSYGAFGPNTNAGDCAANLEAGAVNMDSPTFVLPVGEVPHVAFDHWVATEAAWDGGNVKLSVNGGPWTVVPSGAYSFNAYNGLLNVSDNPLGGEEAFTGGDDGSNGGSWGQSQVDLYGLAFPGDSVQLRFDMGTDGCFGVFGWYVDNVHAYTCSDEEPPICGDGLLDLGEVCDDGNMDDGDGCSSTCEVEDGWVCTDPSPGADSTNVVGDWSFEGGYPNDYWTPDSTYGGLPGFPICNTSDCVDLANTGSWFIWVGGITTGVTSSVEQTVTIPSTSTELTLQAFRGFCSPGMSDTLDVKLDGADIGTLTCDGTDTGYVEHAFDVTAYADDGDHTLYIGSTTTGDGATWTNFFVDDITIEDNVATEPTPSMCKEIVYDLACNAGPVEFIGGIPDSWTVFDNEGTGVVWTDVAGSGLGTNYTGGGGDAASVNSDAFFFTEYDTEMISNTFSLQYQASASLDYLAHYQNIGSDLLEVDITTDGGSNWDNLLSWNEDHGSLFTVGGEAVSIDLGAYLGEPEVQVRWHYYNPALGDWDWYAQVDNVAVTAPDDEDCDGVVDSLDACPGTVFPETPPTNGLGKNRWVLLDGDRVFDTNGKQSDIYTLDDTAGCSCEQIIEAQGLGDGHTKFGCSNSAIKDWIDLVSQ